jgi:hypothetical protein
MARVVPDLNSMYGGERRLAGYFQEVLPPDWTVINSVPWHRSKPIAGKKTGEIDFIVISPSQVLHVIEHTDNFAELNAEGNIIVSHKGQLQNKSRQLNANREAVIQLLQEFDTSRKHRLIYSWLFAPNADVLTATLGMRVENIIDRRASPNPWEAMTLKIQAMEPVAVDCVPDERLISFFQNKLDLTVDPTSLSDNEVRFVGEFEPISSLILNLQCTQKLIKIEGVAGAGKTQIALTGLRRAKKTGASAVLISNSITIPNRLIQCAQNEFPAVHYHGFEKMVRDVPDMRFDQIYIEEAHQLGSERVDFIKLFLSPIGKIFLLFDANQDIDGRLNLKEDAVIFSLCHSYRVPRKIAEILNDLEHIRPKIHSTREVDGDPLNLQTADNPDDGIQLAISAVSDFICKNPHLANRCAFVLGSHKRKLYEIRWPENWRKLTSKEPMDGPVVDTIRRFQGLSRDFIFAAGFSDEVAGEREAQRLFYTVVTRARVRVNIWLPKSWRDLGNFMAGVN